MQYRFKKLYADLVARDSTAVVVYVASIEFMGLRHEYAGLEVYWNNGRREVFRAPKPTLASQAPSGSPVWELRLDVPGGPFVLRYEEVHGPWRPHSGPSEDLRW